MQLMKQIQAWSFLQDDVVLAAQRLLGCDLIFSNGNTEVRLKIVETEAYHQTDAASHSYKGRTPRTDVMFGPAGHLYVYFTYGMHYCMNIVTGPEGEGSAVLIRAVEPLTGLDYLRKHRPGIDDAQLVNGPAKLCKALAITKEWNGHDLRKAPLQLDISPPIPASQLVQTTRIGISRAQDKPWRFYVRNNPYISRK